MIPLPKSHFHSWRRPSVRSFFLLNLVLPLWHTFSLLFYELLYLIFSPSISIIRLQHHILTVISLPSQRRTVPLHPLSALHGGEHAGCEEDVVFGRQDSGEHLKVPVSALRKSKRRGKGRGGRVKCIYLGRCLTKVARWSVACVRVRRGSCNPTTTGRDVGRCNNIGIAYDVFLWYCSRTCIVIQYVYTYKRSWPPYTQSQ
jgi:hypothetical protein